MHHDVRGPRGDLLTRQGKGERRVHKGEDRAVERRIQPYFLPRILIRQHGGVTRLTARSWDGEHRRDGHRARQLCLFRPDIPDVHIRICDAVGDCLRRVDHTPAADGKDEVHIRGEPLADCLADERNARVRLYAAHDEERQPRRGQIHLDAREQPRALRTAAAVENEHAACPRRTQFCGNGILRPPPEDDLRRTMIGKALHETPPLYGTKHTVSISIIAEQSGKNHIGVKKSVAKRLQNFV